MTPVEELSLAEVRTEIEALVSRRLASSFTREDRARYEDLTGRESMLLALFGDRPART